MGSLTALLLATPIYGFALSAPSLQPSLDVSASVVAQLAAADEAQSQDEAQVEAEDSAQAEYIRELKRRNDIADLHRAFGIATWASMTATVVLGVIAYHNLYGFFADQGDNPCVTGDATFGCGTSRTLHAVSAGLTTALYATTFTFSLLMPDPDDLSSGPGEFASTLRLHKTLRWVHFGGMLAQAIIGIVIANNLLGLDRANDYDTLQALGTIHLASGLVTYGALTWAGALMTF